MKMKLSFLTFAATAVASVSSSPAAEVFIFDPAVINTDVPQVSREVARLIFAHRLQDIPDESGPGVPKSVSAVDLDAQVNAYGKPRQSLFSIQRSQRVPQLIIIVEGATEDGMRDVQAALNGATLAFTVPDPPSEEANYDLVVNDFAEYTGSWVGPNSCPLDLAMYPREERCWNGDALVVKYDAKKEPETISLLASSIPQLKKWAYTGELETTLVIIPETTRVGPIDRWAQHPRKLSRRQTETVMELNAQATASATPAPEPGNGNDVVYTPDASTGGIRFANSVCYVSRTRCMHDTFGCFRHGRCREQTEGSGCWRCECGNTKDKFGITTEWTGDMCQKADVSTEFWMFFGVGLLTLLAVGGGMTMLYSVGSEPLPGVLGAGVVKSK